MRICTSLAPALLSISTSRLEVVPRTIESSMSTILFPRTLAAVALSFMRTASSRIDCSGCMKERPTYLFFISASP